MGRFNHFESKKIYHFVENRYAPPTTSPSQFPNLVFYLDADAGLTFGTGTKISRWDDTTTGSGNYGIQGVDGNRPSLIINALNGHNVLRFVSASSQWMDLGSNITSTYNTSFFIVAKLTTNGNYFTPLGNKTGTNYYILQPGDTNTYTRPSIPFVLFSTGYLSSYTTLIVTHPTSTTATLYKDGGMYATGTLNGTTTTGTLNSIGQVQSLFTNGDIACMGIYDRALTTPEALLLSQSLKTKYAI